MYTERTAFVHLQNLLDEPRVILKAEDIKTATDIRGFLVLDSVSMLPRRLISDCFFDEESPKSLNL